LVLIKKVPACVSGTTEYINVAEEDLASCLPLMTEDTNVAGVTLTATAEVFLRL